LIKHGGHFEFDHDTRSRTLQVTLLDFMLQSCSK
jgi:hypothetical protein